MRIEINSGGLFSGTSVKDFAKRFDDVMENKCDVMESFKVVSSRVNTISGGVGVLSSPLAKIEERIQTEEASFEKAQTAARHFSQFLRQVTLADKRVAKELEKRYKSYVSKYSTLSRERSVFSKLSIFLDSEFGGWMTHSLNVTKRWFSRHWKTVVKVGVGIAIAAIAIVILVASGGTAAPLLLLAAKGALIMGAVGAGVSAGVGLYKGHRGEKLINDVADGLISGEITGLAWAVAAAAGAGIVGAVGAKGIFSVAKVGSFTSKLMGGLFTLPVKGVMYTASEAANEGVRYLMNGKGFKDGFWTSTIGKAGFMAVADLAFGVFKPIAEEFVAVRQAMNGVASATGTAAVEVTTVREAFAQGISTAAHESVGRTIIGVVKPSTGSFLGNMAFGNSGQGLLGTIGHAAATTFGNSVDLSEQAAASPGTVRVIFPNGQPLMQVNKMSVTGGVNAQSVSRIGKLTKDRIDSRFSSFLSAPFNQCVRVAV